MEEWGGGGGGMYAGLWKENGSVKKHPNLEKILYFDLFEDVYHNMVSLHDQIIFINLPIS